MNHNTLENYFKTVFSLTYHHGYSIFDIENITPFERDIYMEILKDFMEQKEEIIRNNKSLRG